MSTANVISHLKSDKLDVMSGWRGKEGEEGAAPKSSNHLDVTELAGAVGGGGSKGASAGGARGGKRGYSVTPGVVPMQYFVNDLDMLDAGSRSLPVTPSQTPILAGGSVKSMSLRPPSSGRIGRRSAPNTPFMNADGVHPEIAMGLFGAPETWADDIPETPPMARQTPPFLGAQMRNALIGGMMDQASLNHDMMRIMSMMHPNQENFGGHEGMRNRMGMHHHHHHHHSHLHHHHHHHHGHHGMGGMDETVRLQVDPRTTLDVPKAHLRMTARADAHLRNHGHVGWCQRHHNTGSCSFGQGCAFAHIIDSMVDYYRNEADGEAQNNHHMGGKGRMMGMHHQHHHQHQHQHQQMRGGRPPPLAGLSGMAWHPTQMQQQEEAQSESRSMWGARSAQKEEPSLSQMLQLHANKKQPQSTLSSTAIPYTRPARYWSTQKAPPGSAFVLITEAVTDAISDVLKDTHSESIPTFQDKAQAELTGTVTWAMNSKWLRKQPWGTAPALAIDLSVAAGLNERPVGILSGKVKRIIRSIVRGKVRHVDLSLSEKEVSRQASKDMGLAIAAEFKAQIDDLQEVETISLNRCELSSGSISAIAAALPPRVELVELLEVTGADRFTGIMTLIAQLRSRNQSSTLRMSIKTLDEAKEFTELLNGLEATQAAPIVKLDIRSGPEITHEGRDLLSAVVVPGMIVKVPSLYLPPAANKNSTAPKPDEVCISCNEFSIIRAAEAASYLQSEAAKDVQRIVFDGITSAAAPLLAECFYTVLKNSNIVSLELKISRDEKEKGALQSMLPVLASQAMIAGEYTKLRNLMIELADAPQPDLLDVCLLLPVKHILITAYSDRNSLERVLPPFVDKIKKLSPLNLTTIMIDYGRGQGCEHGMCRVKGPWEKCHMEWVSEGDADEAADEMREPNSTPIQCESRFDLPGRFNALRIAAETVGKPLAEPPLKNAAQVSSVEDFTAALKNQTEINRTSVILTAAEEEQVIDISEIDVNEFSLIEFVHCHVNIGSKTVKNCVFRGGKIIVDGGSITTCTIIDTELEVKGTSTLDENRIITSFGEIPKQLKNSVVMMRRVTDVPAREVCYFGLFPVNEICHYKNIKKFKKYKQQNKTER